MSTASRSSSYGPEFLELALPKEAAVGSSSVESPSGGTLLGEFPFFDEDGDVRLEASELTDDGFFLDEDEEEWEELVLDLEDALAGHKAELRSAGLRTVAEAVGEAVRLVLESEEMQEAVLEEVVVALRRREVDAFVCETEWSRTSGSPAGRHKFIDIPHEESSKRVIVDPEFRSHFNIVNSSPSFASLMQQVPEVFIGTEGVLLLIVELLVEAMRMSLRARDLPVAPWRRKRYLEAKWMAVATRWVPSSVSPAFKSSKGDGVSLSRSGIDGPNKPGSLFVGDSNRSCASYGLSSDPSQFSEGALKTGRASWGQDSVLNILPAQPAGSPSADPALVSALAARFARTSQQPASSKSNNKTFKFDVNLNEDRCASIPAAAPAQVGLLRSLLGKTH
jgi:uncharacterized protein (TIGR01615 family)